MKKTSLLVIALCLLMNVIIHAQGIPLSYYLPEVSYDKSIPTPTSFFGFQIGEQHVSHDMQYMYMRALADASPRITLTEYARTHELRPLVYLTITSERNHGRLEEIRQQHLRLSDPEQNIKPSDQQPIVIYQGYSIHGNEPSGGNAAVLMAYYLAAAQTPELEAMLDNMVILLDPCLNPDGFHRFANWVNMHRNKNLTANPNDREFTESWPRGRSNHYWFDLNRDWLPVQHPESRGRIGVFHHWKPNVLTDHHEMGTNATYFFMPGAPTRANPINPKRNQELTAKIGNYHAQELNKIGSLYYTKEGFDDFYAGKGSTYPDFNACIGILFEQASSRGHVQESQNGLLTFAATIRNQVATSFSTQKAALEMRKELLEYQREFYQSAKAEAKADNRRAFVFGDNHDAARIYHFLDILHTHQIAVHELKKAVTIENKRFEPNTAYVVPLEQQQYRLIRAIFETQTTFEDSIFYDISTWTMPLAFNLTYAAVGSDFNGLLGVRIGKPALSTTEAPVYSDYAYLLNWNDYYAPKVLNALLNAGLRAKVANLPFRNDGRNFSAGTVMIPAQNQSLPPRQIHQLIVDLAPKSAVNVYAVNTGLSDSGIDLGSNNFNAINRQEVLMLVGGGVSSLSAGEIWFQLDQRYDIVLTKVETTTFNRIDLNRYTTIILPDGNYNDLSSGAIEKLKQWLAAGGNLITVGNAVNWVAGQRLANISFKSSAGNTTDKKNQQLPYADLGNNVGGAVLGGAIFQAKADLTHPILFGYQQPMIPVFRTGIDFMSIGKNPYATPLAYTEKPLLSGYINAKNLQDASNGASIVVSNSGRGQVICFADNPVFRGFWFGGNKMLANAIFFGSAIDRRSME